MGKQNMLNPVSLHYHYMHIVINWILNKNKNSTSCLYICHVTERECKQHLHRQKQLQDAKQSISSPVTGNATVPYVIHNWHSFKVTWQDKDVMCLTNSCCLTALPAVVYREGLNREWRLMINTLHSAFTSVFTASLSNSSSLFGFFHVSISSLPVFIFLSPFYICFLSSSPYLLVLCTITTASLLFSSQPILTFLPNTGLRPAVAVWFQLFQVFSQQQGENVMVLAERVCTKSWGMWVNSGKEVEENVEILHILYLQLN